MVDLPRRTELVMPRAFCCLVALATCIAGCAEPSAPAPSAPPAPTTPPAPSEEPPRVTEPTAPIDEAPALDDRASAPTGPAIPLLQGRFTFAPAEPLALAFTDLFMRPDERAHYEAYQTELEGCDLTLGLVSAGLVRPPGELVVEGAEPRRVGPLEVLVLPHRRAPVLGDVPPGVGAVVFEPDGTATDLYVMPSPPSEGAGWDESSDEVQRCLAPARHLLDRILPTLVAARPFESVSIVHFGYEESERFDGPVPYRGVLPAGWVISSGVAWDAGFEHVHRRSPWAPERPLEPTPAAKVWVFQDGPVTLDQQPVEAGPAFPAFGRSLRFGDDGCATELDDLGQVQFVCLTGTPDERAAILSVLATFVPEDGRARPPAPPAPCVGIVRDESDVHVRERPSQSAPVLADVIDGTEVVLEARRGGWALLGAPTRGWVHGSRIEAGACARHLGEPSARSDD